MPILNFLGLSKRSREARRVFQRRGFTLFEVLVVVGIIAILSSFLVGYSRQGNSALLMTSTHTKLSNMLSRAKSLSIQTYFQSQGDSNDIICAHGVHVDVEKQEAFIYQDVEDIAFGCSRDIDDYGDYNSTEDIRLSGELSQVFLQSTNIKIGDVSDGTDLDYVVFIPPDPLVRINADKDKSASIVVTDGEIKLTVTINDQGQIKKE